MNLPTLILPMLGHCKRFLLLLFLAHCLNAEDWLVAEDWPQFRGKNRDGKSESEGLLSNWRTKKPKWVNNIQGAGQGYSSLCVVSQKIYTTGNSADSQFVVCLDLATGKVHWKTEITSVLPNHAVMGARCTPTYRDGKIYVVASDGTAACLDAKDHGKILWSKRFQTDFGGRMMSGWGYSESPLVDGDRIILTPGGADALMVAIQESTITEEGNPKQGQLEAKVLWQTKTKQIGTGKNQKGDTLKSGAGYSSIVTAEIHGKKNYVQFVGNGVVGVDSDTGQILWSSSEFANSTANICMPIVHENHLLYSSAPRGGLGKFRVSNTDGQELIKKFGYKSTELQCHHGGMILHEGHLYFGNGENRGYPTCIDFQSGEVKWGRTIRGPGRGSASIVLADGKLIFRYQNGVVALIKADPNEYQLLGYFKQDIKSAGKSWSHPVVIDGKLLLREQDSIMVYDLEKP